MVGDGELQVLFSTPLGFKTAFQFFGGEHDGG